MDLFDEARKRAAKQEQLSRLPSREEVALSKFSEELSRTSPQLREAHSRLLSKGITPEIELTCWRPKPTIFNKHKGHHETVARGWSVYHHSHTSSAEGGYMTESTSSTSSVGIVLSEEGELYEHEGTGNARTYNIDAGFPPGFLYPEVTKTIKYSYKYQFANMEKMFDIFMEDFKEGLIALIQKYGI
ncbi:hypothetical protein BH23PAT1_BH23PAT1_1720 [soil metagenome]